MKKLTSILLALVMALSLCVTAFAEGGHTVTITKDSTDTATHSYEAYQIFTGDLSNGKLSNVNWGSGIDTGKLSGLATAINALRNTEAEGYKALTASSAAADFAAAISELKATHDDATAQKIAAALGAALSTTSGTGSATGVSGLSDGYYLIKDQKDSLADAQGAYTRYILQVLGKDVTVDEKASVPSVQKKVDDKNDSNNSEDATTWQDSADYDIGDAVPFQLKATTASTVHDYTKYHVTFQDKQSGGLTAPEKFTVKVGDTTLPELTNAVNQSVTATDTANNVKITAAVVAADSGNTFAVKVTFEPTESGAKLPAAYDGQAVVVEYTSVLNNQAVLGSTGNPNEVYLKYSNNPNSTDDNEEGKTPTDKVIVFTYKVVVNKVDQNKQALKGASFELLKKVNGEWTSLGVVNGTDASTFEWKGIDDGDYKLVETATPEGYNTIAPIEFTVSAEHDVLADAPTLTSLSGGNKFTGEVSTGNLTGEVVNQEGSELPSTGGVGTTLFYAIGGMLVVGAATVLISKKRMED